MANRWGNSGNSDRLNFGGSKVSADGDCSHEIKRRLLLGRCTGDRGQDHPQEKEMQGEKKKKKKNRSVELTYLA